MLPTFVIALREGLEAALIVGIIAAFLRKQGRLDRLRQVWLGVAIAVLICVAVGVGLEIASHDLPQDQQEGLETIIAALAVAMVTYMIVWMKGHSRGLKSELEAMASDALGSTGGRAASAMVLMAFLAVMREGFETVVFLIAAFNQTGSGISAGIGAVLGLAVAVGIGYGIYRGGVRLNLSRFFRATGLVLALVAAGLVVSALHTAHEAGWLDIGQQQVLDLHWLVQPGSALASLLTGVLGVQPYPVLIEVVGWLLYAIPVCAFVAWPQGHPVRSRAVRTTLAAALGVAIVASVAVVATAPGGGSNVEAASDVLDGGSGGGSGPAAHSAKVNITAAKGCQIDHHVLAAGGIVFHVANQDSNAVSEVEVLSGQRIIGEKENLPAGFGGTFAINVPAGSYTLYCPGAPVEKSRLRVTGTAKGADDDTAALLTRATKDYGKYVDAQIGHLLRAVRRLDTALHGTDLHAAQVAYAKARPFYEKIEPVAESFTVGSNDLDADIDARINDVPASRFRGFHRIEMGLFKDRSLRRLASYGDGLVDNVEKLQRLAHGLQLQPTELANGAQELLDEVASTKITGEEERYSHMDVLDIANNVEGSEQAFAQLAPALRRIDPSLTGRIKREFTSLEKLVDHYRDPQPSGYVLYGALNGSDRRRLAAAVKAVQEPLSQVAGKVAR